MEERLALRFERLPEDFTHAAENSFDAAENRGVIRLRADWEDVDLAHELMHLRLEVLEGWPVLAWRKNAARAPKIEAAMGRLQTYVLDEMVHARLIERGLKLDGEVFKRQLFDDIFTNVTLYLAEGRSRPDDGMAHLDDAGYGDLRRAAFLVQAELLIQNYGSRLAPKRLKLARNFITRFRAHRKREARHADVVLALFAKNSPLTPEGSARILAGWSRLAGLGEYVGPSSYRMENGRTILPWP